MSWFVILLMFLVFAMMIGPILMAKPSPRERRLARLRSQAANLGLRVSLQTLDGRTHAVYELPWERSEQSRLVGVEWLLDRQTYTHGIHFAEWWQWRGEGRPPAAALPLLASRLPLLPEGVSVVEANFLSLRCYWSEAGGDQRLLQLAEWLKTTAELMKPYISPQPEAVDPDLHR